MQNNTANNDTSDMQPKQCGRHFKPWSGCPNVGLHNWFIKSLGRQYTSTITYKIAKEEYETSALLKESGLKKIWLDEDEEQLV